MMPLQVFEKHPTADAYRVGGFYSPYCLVATEKRFHPGEVAAEYWRSREDRAYIVEGITWEAMADDWPISEAAANDRESVLECFASRPHAHEIDYE